MSCTKFYNRYRNFNAANLCFLSSLLFFQLIFSQNFNKIKHVFYLYFVLFFKTLFHYSIFYPRSIIFSWNMWRNLIIRSEVYAGMSKNQKYLIIILLFDNFFDGMSSLNLIYFFIYLKSKQHVHKTLSIVYIQRRLNNVTMVNFIKYYTGMYYLKFERKLTVNYNCI